MSTENINYAVVGAVATDFAISWPSWLPEPTLQNFMYAATILWIGIQVFYKLKGRD